MGRGSFTKPLLNLSSFPSRLLQLNHQNVLKVLDVHFNRVGVLHAIVPYMESNLFDMLCSNITATRAPLWDRLVIAHGIVKACEFLAERGFRVTDLRPNNVLVG
jgi:serine/threonine protein kinase